jgi:hypothetical protein
MNWLKKNSTLLLWGLVSLVWVWKDAPRGVPTFSGFMATLGAYLVSSGVFLAGIFAVVCAFAILKAIYDALTSKDDEEDDNVDDEPLDPHEAFRKINLSCGDGHCHPDACCALSGLRAAGYHIEKSGSERGGFVYLKIIPPGKE